MVEQRLHCAHLCYSERAVNYSHLSQKVEPQVRSIPSSVTYWPCSQVGSQWGVFSLLLHEWLLPVGSGRLHNGGSGMGKLGIKLWAHHWQVNGTGWWHHVLLRKSQQNKVARLIGSLKTLFYQHPYSAHLLLRVRSNIQYDEHRDYPAAYNKPLFAFEEPLFCRPFPNISASLPGELPRASQGHWLLSLWGLRVTMHRRVWMVYNWEQ